MQPNSSAEILNRVTGSTTSVIAGTLTANGVVYLVNPNGVAITPSGTVDVGGGFVASTLALSDAAFLQSQKSFQGSGTSAAVSNAGVISIGRGGYAALIGGHVSNAGLIAVPLGQVALGSGEQATLDVSGDGFLQVAVPTAGARARPLVSDSGRIVAPGSLVILDAATAVTAARNAVNITGAVNAWSIGGQDGDIQIGGGAGGFVGISGELSATSAAGTGGDITVTGQQIGLYGATLNASGYAGGGTILIGGDEHGDGPLQQVDVVRIGAATTLVANAASNGNGGQVVVWSQDYTRFAGLIFARGGPQGGNGGEAEVSSHGLLDYTGFANLTAPLGNTGTLLLDPCPLLEFPQRSQHCHWRQQRRAGYDFRDDQHRHHWNGRQLHA